MNTPSPKPARAELVLRTAKKRQALALGQELSVGRDPSCRLRLKKSPGPSRLFRVFAHQSSYRLEVFEGADVSLDGEACDQAELADGSIIRAANLSFEVRLPAAAPTASTSPRPSSPLS